MPRRSGFRALVIGVDGSRHSRRAVAFVASLKPPAGGRAAVVYVVEPVLLPSMPLVPASVRSRIVGQAAALSASRMRAARREVDAAVRRLKRAGWRARGEVRVGMAVVELLQAVNAVRADLLVVGARGVRGVTRFLLGSVADAALRRAPVSVLIVR